MYIRAVRNLTALIFWLAFIRLHYIIGVRRFEFQMAIKIFLDVKHIFLVVIPCQLVVEVMGQIVLVGEERPDTAQLQATLATVHDGQLIPAHKFFAVMSSDELR